MRYIHASQLSEIVNIVTLKLIFAFPIGMFAVIGLREKFCLIKKKKKKTKSSLKIIRNNSVKSNQI